MIYKVYQKVTWKNALISSIIFIGFVAFVLPYISALSTRLIGISDSPDTMFAFDLNRLYQIRELYGEYGRRIYIILRYTFDIIWPIVYTLFFVSSLVFLDRRTIKKGIVILYLPFLAVLFDLCENIGATIFFVIYPMESDFIGIFVLASSMFKWLFVLLNVFCILALSIIYLIRRIQNVKK